MNKLNSIRYVTHGIPEYKQTFIYTAVPPKWPLLLIPKLCTFCNILSLCYPVWGHYVRLFTEPPLCVLCRTNRSEKPRQSTRQCVTQLRSQNSATSAPDEASSCSLIRSRWEDSRCLKLALNSTMKTELIDHCALRLAFFSLLLVSSFSLISARGGGHERQWVYSDSVQEGWATFGLGAASPFFVLVPGLRCTYAFLNPGSYTAISAPLPCHSGDGSLFRRRRPRPLRNHDAIRRPLLPCD